MPILVVLLSLIYLFISKKKITSEFSRLIHKFGGGRGVVIWLWSIIFLPGTVLHEITHFLVAAATGTRTGKVEIFPENLEEEWEAEETGKGITLGYVQTQRLNPIRGFLVGMAPFFFGLAFLIWLASLLQTSFEAGNYSLFALELYLFFTIANSFFPSWSDIKQTLPLIVILLIAGVVALFFGFQLQITPGPQFWGLIDSLNFALLISVILNTLVLGILLLLNRITKR